MGLIEHRRCEISRGKRLKSRALRCLETLLIPTIIMKWHIVFASILIFLMQTYVLNKNYWWGFSPASHPAPRSLKHCLPKWYKIIENSNDYITLMFYVGLVLVCKNIQFHIICSFYYSISINSTEADPHLNSLQSGIVKPKNIVKY